MRKYYVHARMPHEFTCRAAAEVQLGGYDPATTVGEMWYTPCL